MASKLRGALDKAKRFILALEITTNAENAEQSYFFADRELGNLSFDKKETAQFFDCIDDIYNAVDRELIDKKNIQSWFQTAILKALDFNSSSGLQLRQRADDAIAELLGKIDEAPTDWTVYIPVEGLSVQGLPIQVGQVLFRAGNRGLEKRIKSEVSQVMAISPDTPKTKYDFQKATINSFNKHWKDRPVAQICVRAKTQNAAHAQGMRVLQRTIDVINFFAHISIETGNGGRIYLPGDTSRGQNFSLSCRFSDEGKCIDNNVKNYLVGSLSAFLLSKDTVKILNKYGFREASDLLAKKAKNEWDNRILSALQWAGRATSNGIVNEKIAEETGARREEAFMLYAIAMESLLLKKGSEITYKFSTRGAHILFKKVEDRKRARKRLIELYGLRSDVVHSGFTEITEKDLWDMAMFTRTTISRILKSRELRSFEKWSEFDEWMEEKMLR